MNDRERWLEQVREEAIAPELPICDPHHHLWDHPNNRYLLDELLADIGGGHNIRSTVFVECASMYRADGDAALRPVGETEFVNGVAAMSASGRYGEMRVCAGIVGFADLTLGDRVGGVLEAHRAASSRFRGIRHALGFDPSPDVRDSHSQPSAGLMADPTFRAGFAQLARHDLSFDAWLYHPQLPELVDLARAFPDTVIILDHFGGPLGIGPYAGRHDEYFPQWQRDIEDLARCPNVFAKLGGLVMPLNGFEYHKRDTPPTSAELAAVTSRWYQHCLASFGVDRCMFESNFPVDKASCSYTVLWNSFKRIAADYSVAEKAALFHDTAARVYRLEVS
jgi:L-fuconolactonase